MFIGSVHGEASAALYSPWEGLRHKLNKRAHPSCQLVPLRVDRIDVGVGWSEAIPISGGGNDGYRFPPPTLQKSYCVLSRRHEVLH